MKRRIILLTLLLPVLGLLAWLVLRPHEPVFEGKRLTFWLDRYGATYSKKIIINGLPTLETRFETNAVLEAEHARAESAVRHIGTNAIPTLLRQLRARNSPLAIKVDTLIKRQHFIKSPIFLALDKNVRGSIGFSILGTEAKSAVPALTEIYEENISVDSRTGAAEALSSMGADATPAIPALVRGTADTNFRVRAISVLALDQIHEEPELVVPAFIKCVADTNHFVSVYAIRGLAKFGPVARSAVPGLVNALQAADPWVRMQAAEALEIIDPEAAAKAGFK